jgi:hypothetical protein
VLAKSFKIIAGEKGGFCISNIYTNGRTKLEFSCSCGYIWKAEPRHVIDGRWCPKCGHQKGRRYDIDHEFFSRNTEESFYTAGFLAADGWKTRRAGGAFSIGLQLWAEDVDHLRVIRNLMRCTTPLKFRKRKNKSGTISFSYGFVTNSEQCYSDLERFGVVENKTYVLRMSDWLCKHPLVHHFMRGYIDGDGCFSLVNTKDQRHIHFSMRGTKEFLEAFHGVLFAAGVCDEAREIIANSGKKHLAFGKLQYGGNGMISKLYDFLYHDATVFLPRKEEIARMAKELAVYGDGVFEKKRKVTSLPITKEILLEKAKEFKSGQKIAKFFGCTSANISWWIKELDIKKDFDRAVGRLDRELAYQMYQELGSYTAVANKLGVTRARIAQVVKEFLTAA